MVGANGQNFYTGTPTVGSSASFALSSIDCVNIQMNLIGGGGTVVVETSMDGGTFWNRPSIFQMGTSNYTNSFTLPFSIVVNTSGVTHIRARAISAFTGTGTIIVVETLNSRTVSIVDSALPFGASTAANQTTQLTALQLIDDIVHLQNATLNKAVPMMGQLDDTATIVATEDNVSVARITAQRALHVNFRDSSGAEGGTPTNPINLAPGRDVNVAECTTATPLGISGVFTSSTADLSLLEGSEITIGVFTNVASAALGLQIQWSHDSVNFDHIESYTIPAMSAGQGKTFTQRKVARYLRIIFTNGAVAQASFRLTTTMNVLAAKPSSHRIGSVIDDDNDAELVKANLIGRKATGSHENVALTNSNEIKVADGLRSGGVYGAVSSTTANVAIEAKVGVARLTNRKFLQITIQSTGVFYGLDNAVTVSSGTPVANGQVLTFTIDPDSTFQVWLVSASINRAYRFVESP